MAMLCLLVAPKERLPSAGMSDDASEEEVRNLRVEALRCMTRSILRGTIVNVMPGRKLVLSERPPEDLSINPSQQQLGGGPPGCAQGQYGVRLWR